MNPDKLPPGVGYAPMYTAVPCEESTVKLADYVVQELNSTPRGLDDVELYILRWLVDNNMAIVRRD